MKQQSLIITLVVIALVFVGLYFAWDFVKDIIDSVKSAVMGTVALGTAKGVANIVR